MGQLIHRYFLILITTVLHDLRLVDSPIRAMNMEEPEYRGILIVWRVGTIQGQLYNTFKISIGCSSELLNLSAALWEYPNLWLIGHKLAHRIYDWHPKLGQFSGTEP